LSYRDSRDLQERIESMDEEEFLELARMVQFEANDRNLTIPELKLAGGLATEGASVEHETSDVEASPATKAYEMILGQVDVAYETYNEVCKLLGVDLETKEEDVREELSVWLTEDKLEYVAAAKEADPELEFTLVATPNMIISASLLQKLFTNFSQDETKNFGQLLSYFNPEELCGTDPINGNSTMFALIPNKVDERLYGDITKQIFNLEELQQSDLSSLKVPSVLEAAVYWFVLRNSQKLTNERGTLRQTYVNHFNLTNQLPEYYRRFVIASCIDDVGHAWLKEAYSNKENSGKVAVG
jgi:hypothetical protein